MTQQYHNGGGALVRPHKVQNYDYSRLCAAEDFSDLPESYVLPEDRIPTVRDQGEIEACVAFSLSEVLGILHGLEFGEEKLLSPWFIYGNEVCRPDYTGTGMYTDEAIDGVRKIGTVPLPFFSLPCEMPEMQDKVSERGDLKNEAAKYRIKSFAEIPRYAQSFKFNNCLKKAVLDNQLPVVATSSTYFRGGGHCFIIIGWKGDQALILNSWGDSWKDHGRGFVPMQKIDEAYVLFDKILELTFDDVKVTDWFYDDVRKAVFSGIIQGIDKHTFAPQDHMTRAEAAAAIVRAIEKFEESINAYIRTQNQLGKIDCTPITILTENGTSYPDVHSDDWYYNAVNKISSGGIMLGDDTGAFRPLDPISRAEVAAIMNRVLKKMKDILTKDLNLKINPDTKKPLTFTDVIHTDWFYDDVQTVYSMGLIQGDNESEFRPDAPITRAEETAIMVRVLHKFDEWLLQVVLAI